MTQATRRAFLGGAVAVLSVPAPGEAKPPHPPRHIGVLMATRDDDPVDGGPGAAALVSGLAEYGWNAGGNLRIDWRWAAGEESRYRRYAGELLALGPDLVVGHASPGVAALRQLTQSLPIVFVEVTDPVRQGFVESLAHPGGNTTGFSDFDLPMGGKWLEMLAQIEPRRSRVAVLFNPATAPFAAAMMPVIEAAARPLGMRVGAAPVDGVAAVESAISGLAAPPSAGLLVLPEAFTAVHREGIAALAAHYRVPAVYGFRVAGGLMSYSADGNDLFRRAAVYVDRILLGAKPGDLPVQNPTKFETIVNLKAANSLGVTLAPSLLALANQVIE
ncbi:MAG: ABC transporter substrate-binding protein [Thiohalocapsa sp.]